VDADSFLAAHPDIEQCEALLFDLNGLPRGKWVPRAQLPRLLTEGLRMPRSAMALDMWGREAPVPGSGIDAGDPDAVCPADPATLVSVPWLPGTAQVVLDMPPPPGGGATEPRQLLKQAIARLAALGLKAVVATELEFYLLAGDSPPRAADLPLSRRPQRANQHQSVDMLEEFSGLLAEIHRACAIQGLPTDTTVTEFGTGQFEINLRHQADALAAADQAVAFRRLVRGVARRHGLVASFMAKPFGDQAGSGLHVHASLLDATGRNVFDDGTAAGSPLLKAAIGGLLDAMPATTLLFAPHLNSYRRLRPGSYAPTAASWGYDNRTAAVRVPFGAGADRRFEHRVAGADANPYLVIAAILAAAHHGIVQSRDAGEPVTANGYLQARPALPTQWDQAIDTFERSAFTEDYFGGDFRKLFAACKRHEAATFASRVTDFEYETYLRSL
jgi:glutamine synthetase